MALVVGLPAVAGLLAGGAIMSRIGKGEPQRLLRLCGIVLLISTPFGVAVPLCTSARLPLVLLFVWSLFSSTYIGSAWSVLISAIPPPMRGTIMGLGIVLTNLMGPGFGQQMIGLVSDALYRLNDTAHLQHALAGVALFALIPASIFLDNRTTNRSTQTFFNSIRKNTF
jgi:predicted MFS family arabinose efflux permease